jgi:N-acetylated-alpha-linked acidic dipeptidase
MSLSTPEDPLSDDPHSQLEDEMYRVNWTAYSPNLDFTAPVVYANFGRAEDYDELARRGVDVRGKIVLVRYFRGYRAGKTQEAERRGAVALIIYCDPAEDGSPKGPVFPDGPWGPAGHFQRGANVYDFIVPGDPLTPGWPSVRGARRIRADQSKILPRLAMIPISARAAGRLMERLGGIEAPHEWQGGLGVTYRLGDGPARVHFLNRVTRERRQIQNIFARVEGTNEPEKVVLLSNHYDAWVYGAVDPCSGTAAMLELARAFGDLRARGWRPRRTLLLANWDAEEYTLTGSTEWGEQHAALLRRNLIACLNVDTAVSGNQLVIGAAPSLDRVLGEVARVVQDPQTRTSLYERWGLQKPEQAPGSYATASGTVRELNARILGSGSDYTVFFNHIGVPSVDISFEGPYGVYHSVYDGFVWMDRFGDPGFQYHATVARLWGVLALRLANADVLPLDFAPYAQEIRAYVQDLAQNYRVHKRVGDLHPILKQLDLLERAALSARAWVEKLTVEGDSKKLARLNAAFQTWEQTLTVAQGIPGRPWFRHLIYAPLPTYAAETVPGIREAVVAGNWLRASAQSRVLLAALRRATKQLERVAK